MLRQEQGKNTKQTEVKQRHPAFAVSNDMAVTPGRTVRPQEIITSPAVKEINREGYVVYNTPEKQDIYITIQPESAFFEEEEPRMVRMDEGSFIGGDRNIIPAAMPVRSEEESKPISCTQPADIFSNACRREEFEEIDFNEVIIKKNDSFDMEFEESPVFFRPSYEGISELVLEESFKMEAVNEAAMTSSAEVKTEQEKVFFEGFSEEPEYMLQEVSAEKAPVTEVPAGLYVDGHKQIDPAEAGDEGVDEPSLLKEAMFVEVETAVTSVSAPIDETVVPLPTGYLSLPSLEEAEPAEEIVPEVVAEEADPIAEPVFEAAEEEAESIMETVPEVIEEEAEPVTEAVCEAIEEEAEPVMETEPEFIAEETEPEAEAVTEVIEEEAEPVLEMMSEVVMEETEPIAEAVTEAIEEETVPAMETVSEVTMEEAEPIAEPVTEMVVEEAEPVAEIPEVVAEEGSETIADEPVQVEVFDEVADIMKITVPSLRMSDELMLELAQDWERTIPEDGLEAHDRVFRPIRISGKEECISYLSSGSEGRKSSGKPDPYFNFRVD